MERFYWSQKAMGMLSGSLEETQEGLLLRACIRVIRSIVEDEHLSGSASLDDVPEHTRDALRSLKYLFETYGGNE